LKHAENFSLSADTVDALTGKRVGRPPSATFRTLDIVGLDVMSNVVKNIYENAKDDPWIELFKLPAWIDDLIEKGCLGSKTKKGIYEKKGKDIYVFDPKKNEYRLSDKTISPEVKKILKENGSIEKALLSLSECNDPQAQFLWSVYRDVFHYACYQLEHLAETVRCVDLALKSGFGWHRGIFEQAKSKGYKLVSYIHPSVVVVGDFEFGENCFVFENSVIQPFVKIGDDVIVWSGSLISHNTTIKDHCFIASHVAIAGSSTIEPYCFLGTNCTLRNGIKIAKGCVIGAGCVILEDTKEKEVFVTRSTAIPNFNRDLLKDI